jgi:hypothetical protein
MFTRVHAARFSRVRSRMTALTVAASLVVPGAFLVLTPSTAGAQGSDPLGPTIAQVEAAVATAVANVQGTLSSLELLVTGPFGLESTVSCLLADLSGHPGFGPCVDGG